VAVLAMTFLAGITVIFCLLWFAIMFAVIVAGVARKQINLQGLLSSRLKNGADFWRFQSLACTIFVCSFLIYYGISSVIYHDVKFPDLPVGVLLLSWGSHGLLIGATAIAHSRAPFGRNA
jgi:hypothetical protein